MKLYIVKLNCFDTDKKMVKLYDTVGKIKIFLKKLFILWPKKLREILTQE